MDDEGYKVFVKELLDQRLSEACDVATSALRQIDEFVEKFATIFNDFQYAVDARFTHARINDEGYAHSEKTANITTIINELRMVASLVGEIE